MSNVATWWTGRGPAAAGAQPDAGSTLMRLLLIRHAEAHCNVRAIWAGHDTCAGLTSLGRDQALALRRRLRSRGEARGAAVLLSSAMPRAIETADLIQPAFDGSSTSRLIDCGLCERHPGAATEIRRWTPDDPGGASDAFDDPDGAESRAAFAVRVARAFRRLRATCADQTVVVVTHTGVIAGSFAALGNVLARQPFDLRPGHASITEWTNPDPSSGRWELVRYNDTCHLRG